MKPRCLLRMIIEDAAMFAIALMVFLAATGGLENWGIK